MKRGEFYIIINEMCVNMARSSTALKIKDNLDPTGNYWFVNSWAPSPLNWKYGRNVDQRDWQFKPNNFKYHSSTSYFKTETIWPSEINFIKSSFSGNTRWKNYSSHRNNRPAEDDISNNPKIFILKLIETACIIWTISHISSNKYCYSRRVLSFHSFNARYAFLIYYS